MGLAPGPRVRTFLLPALLLLPSLCALFAQGEPGGERLPFACWAGAVARLQADLRALPRDPSRSAGELRARLDALIGAAGRVDPVHARLVAEARNLAVMEAALTGPVLELEAALHRLDRAGLDPAVEVAFRRVHAARWAGAPLPGARQALANLSPVPTTAGYAAFLEGFLPM